MPIIIRNPETTKYLKHQYSVQENPELIPLRNKLNYRLTVIGAAEGRHIQKLYIDYFLNKTHFYVNKAEELDNWFELSNPAFIIALIGVYLLSVFICFPKYMHKRKPYQLKVYIVLYNILQVIACIYTVISIFQITGTKIFQFWMCSYFESNSYADFLFNRIIRFTFWVKTIELTETLVFVLRKKYNQVSKLHVFHHCATLTLIYVLGRYFRGGSALYPLLLNSIVHIIMYSYYLAAAVCEKRKIRQLLPLKKCVTTIQMIQFVLILTQVVISNMLCKIELWLISYYSLIIIVMLYGFWDFYKMSYTRECDRKKKNKN